jgi:hypothetical protein
VCALEHCTCRGIYTRPAPYLPLRCRCCMSRAIMASRHGLEEWLARHSMLFTQLTASARHYCDSPRPRFRWTCMMWSHRLKASPLWLRTHELPRPLVLRFRRQASYSSVHLNILKAQAALTVSRVE